MKAVNDITIKDFNDLAKNTLPTMYVNGYTGLYEILRQCWHIYEDEDNQRITMWHRLATLRLASEVTHKKFDILVNGPAIMELGGVKDRAITLRDDIHTK